MGIRIKSHEVNFIGDFLKKEYKIIEMSQLKPSQGVLSDSMLKRVSQWMNENSDFSIKAFYKNGYYHVFDGHHRAYIWNKLNQTKIKIEVMKASKQVLEYVSLYRKPGVQEIQKLEIIPHNEFVKMNRNK